MRALLRLSPLLGDVSSSCARWDFFLCREFGYFSFSVDRSNLYRSDCGRCFLFLRYFLFTGVFVFFGAHVPLSVPPRVLWRIRLLVSRGIDGDEEDPINFRNIRRGLRNMDVVYPKNIFPRSYWVLASHGSLEHTDKERAYTRIIRMCCVF